MVSPLAGWNIGAPEGWASWPPRQGQAHADRVAADLADGVDAQVRVRDSVLALDATIPDGPVLTAAVWVPDRTTGEVAGFLVADVLVGAEGVEASAEAFHASVAKPRKERGVKVFHYSTSTAEVPAGPAVVEARTWAEKKNRQVLSGTSWTIFPPGSNEAIRLELTTPYESLADPLALQSVEIANSLTVDLQDQP